MKKYSQLIVKYQKQYQRNKNSLVFVPFAEAYRKIGLLDEAIALLKEGLRTRPNYHLAVVTLGRCYFDQQKYELAYKVLFPLMDHYRDNVILQKVLGQTCEQLGYFDQALDCYKYLLYLNPKDKFFQEKVKKIEGLQMVSLRGGAGPLSVEETTEPQLDKMGWEEKTFSPSELSESEERPLLNASPLPLEPLLADDMADIFGHALVSEAKIENDVGMKSEVVASQEEGQREIEIDEELEEDQAPVQLGPKAQSPDSNPPFLSLTLAQLYEKQGHLSRALEVVKDMIKCGHTDDRFFAKLQELESKIQGQKSSTPQELTHNSNPPPSERPHAERNPHEGVLLAFLNEIKQKGLSKKAQVS